MDCHSRTRASAARLAAGSSATALRTFRPDSLAADRAYSNGPVREHLRRRGVRHAIPEKTDSQAARLRKGAHGGRPPAFDEDRYKRRNTVERAINRLK